MATITSAAAGNWSTPATWVGGVVPAIGDTAKLNHRVTLDGNFDVGGIDPTGSAALVNGQVGYRLAVGSGGVMYMAKGVVYAT